jgi:hypothetical protein
VKYILLIEINQALNQLTHLVEVVSKDEEEVVMTHDNQPLLKLVRILPNRLQNSVGYFQFENAKGIVLLPGFFLRDNVDNYMNTLTHLFAQAIAGEEVLIILPETLVSNNEFAVIKILSMLPKEPRRSKAGSAKGMVTLSDDFDEPIAV